MEPQRAAAWGGGLQFAAESACAPQAAARARRSSHSDGRVDWNVGCCICTCNRRLWWKCLPTNRSRSDRQPAAAPGRRAAVSRCSKASPSARLRDCLGQGSVRQDRAGRSPNWKIRPGMPGKAVEFCICTPRTQRAACLPFASCGPGTKYLRLQDAVGRSLRGARACKSSGPPRGEAAARSAHTSGP